MKTTLVASLALLVLLPSPAPAEDKPLKERAAEAVTTLKRETREATAVATRAARQAWKATKEYVTEDPREFREGAVRKLDDLTTEVATLQDQAHREPLAQRKYFGTRVTALREHLDYARAALTKLPAEKKGADYDATRQHFTYTLEQLDQAVDQAQAEARDLR